MYLMMSSAVSYFSDAQSLYIFSREGALSLSYYLAGDSSFFCCGLRAVWFLFSLSLIGFCYSLEGVLSFLSLYLFFGDGLSEETCLFFDRDVFDSGSRCCFCCYSYALSG